MRHVPVSMDAVTDMVHFALELPGPCKTFLLELVNWRQISLFVYLVLKVVFVSLLRKLGENVVVVAFTALARVSMAHLNLDHFRYFLSAPSSQEGHLLVQFLLEGPLQFREPPKMLPQEELYDCSDQCGYLIYQVDAGLLHMRELVLDALVDGGVVEEVGEVDVLILLQQTFNLRVVFFLMKVEEATPGKFKVVP